MAKISDSHDVARLVEEGDAVDEAEDEEDEGEAVHADIQDKGIRRGSPQFDLGLRLTFSFVLSSWCLC